MGLFGRDFNWGRAAIGLFSPEAAQHLNAQDAARAQSAEEQRQRSVIQQAAEQMGIPKSVINTLSMEDLSRLVLSRTQQRQFDSGGGSVQDPITGQWTIAPSERSVGRDIIRTNSQGQSAPVYQGVEPVAVPPGGGLYGVNGQGQASEIISPYGSQPQTAQPPNAPTQPGGPTPGTVVNGFVFRGGNPNDRNNWQPLNQGGAAPGPRNFPSFPF